MLGWEAEMRDRMLCLESRKLCTNGARLPEVSKIATFMLIVTVVCSRHI
jgi:hypothetical protein